MIEYEEFTVVFTGDAEGITEDQARANFSGAVLATVLTGSHHGAATFQSNDDDWAEATAPSITVFSSGTRFGHPRCDAVQIYDLFTEDIGSHPTHCGVRSVEGTRPEARGACLGHRLRAGASRLRHGVHGWA